MAELANALGRPSITLKDCEGKVWELGVLRLGDLADLEGELGCALSESGAALATVTGQLSLLWIMIRRVGLTKQQVAAARQSKAWPVTKEEVGELFTRDQITEVFQKVSAAMSPSGVAAAPANADPTTVAAKTTTEGTTVPAGGAS